MNRKNKFQIFDKNTKIMSEPFELSELTHWNLIWGDRFKGQNEVSFCDLNWREYTGLKDRTGKDVYEGDILKYVDNWEFPNEDDTSHHLIYWDEERARFTDLRIEDGDSLCAYEDGIYWISDSEVIGNKFENPEYLNI
jgi:uncharacterized phage protein (TIGR01671 family)